MADRRTVHQDKTGEEAARSLVRSSRSSGSSEVGKEGEEEAEGKMAAV